MYKKAFGIGLAAVLVAAAFSGFSSKVNAAGNLTTELAAQSKGKSGGGKSHAAPKASAKSAPKAKAASKSNVGGKKNVGSSKSVNSKKNVTVNKNVNVKKNVTVNKNVNIHDHGHGHYRSWNRRAYYGSAFIGAVALGTIVAVSAPHVIPVVPGDNACWYWSDPSETSGYWDYCVVP